MILRGESEDDLRAMMRRFVEVCKKRGLESMQISQGDGVEWRGEIGVWGFCERDATGAGVKT